MTKKKLKKMPVTLEREVCVFVPNEKTKDQIFPPPTFEEVRQMLNPFLSAVETLEQQPEQVHPQYYADTLPQVGQCVIMCDLGEATHEAIAVVDGVRADSGTPLAIVDALHSAYALGSLHAHREKIATHRQEIVSHEEALKLCLRGNVKLLETCDKLKQENKRLRDKTPPAKKKAAP